MKKDDENHKKHHENDVKDEKKNDKEDKKAGQKLMLNWRCIDDFDKALAEGKVFRTGSVPISKRQEVVLRDIFADMKEKWTKEAKRLLDDLKMQRAQEKQKEKEAKKQEQKAKKQEQKAQESKKKEEFEITGGNYTFFFVLPYLLKYFRKDHPFLRINVNFLEVESPDDLKKYHIDCLLSGTFSDPNTFRSKIHKNGYLCSRKVFKDPAYLAASKESVNKFGNKENVLEKHNMIFGKIYENYSLRKTVDPKYNYGPSNRANENPRISIDFYYMSYHLMSQSLGIAYVFSSCNNISEFIILDKEPITQAYRFIVFRKDLKISYKKTMKKGLKDIKWKK